MTMQNIFLQTIDTAILCYKFFSIDNDANASKQGKSKMTNTYEIEITDTFGGEANYCWVKRDTITMPELTHYGYDGATNYGKANKAFRRQLVRKAKAIAGWTGARCETIDFGDMIEIRPRNACMVAFVTFKD